MEGVAAAVGSSAHKEEGEVVFPPIKNDLIIRAALGQHVERVPIWIMRQAGRYLPEYNDVRLTGGADFFTICKTKELAARITLQPIERYPLDAAIIFTDILVVPQALGLEVQMLKGEGDLLYKTKELNSNVLENLRFRSPFPSSVGIA